jgi:hypothetical protein
MGETHASNLARQYDLDVSPCHDRMARPQRKSEWYITCASLSGGALIGAGYPKKIFNARYSSCTGDSKPSPSTLKLKPRQITRV